MSLRLIASPEWTMKHWPSGMLMVPLWVIDERSIWLRGEDGCTRPWNLTTFKQEFEYVDN